MGKDEPEAPPAPAAVAPEKPLDSVAERAKLYKLTQVGIAKALHMGKTASGLNALAALVAQAAKLSGAYMPEQHETRLVERPKVEIRIVKDEGDE
jgi:hypothetical protein